MKALLFYTFLAIFAVTSTITLLALVGVLQIVDGFLGYLVTAFLIESAGAVVALFKSARFFDDAPMPLSTGKSKNETRHGDAVDARLALPRVRPPIEVRSSFRAFNYKALILESKELVVLLNDGRSWIDTNRELIRDRLSNKDRISRFCFIHPASPYIDLLICKNGKAKATQLDEIRRSVELLREISPPWADIEVRAHMRPSPYCLFLTEDVAVVDPFLFFEVGSLPMISCARDTEMYRTYNEDARKLLKESLPLGADSFGSD